MQSRLILEALDRTFRDLRNRPEEPFGGIVMVLAGDWKQILPIVKNGTRASIVSVTHKRSFLWSNVKILKLTENMRIRSIEESSIEFNNFASAVGNAEANIN